MRQLASRGHPFLIGYHERIRYLQSFPTVIPVIEADYPRVTHPCATLLRTEVPFAFDLHVLSTPPAFNLSQNQTLQLIENN